MSDRLKEIDAIRGLAALIVAFIFHQHYLTGQFQSGPLDGLPVFSFLHKHGWVAVDLFFVISGFIFAHVYIRTGRLQVSGFRFFWARFARLYPLHLVTLLLCAGTLAFGTPFSASYVDNSSWNFFLNLMMLQESGLQTSKSFNTPAWSISVEIMCYVVFYFTASRFPSRMNHICALLAIGGLLATVGNDPTIEHIARGFCGFFSGVVLYRYRDVSRDRMLSVCLFGAISALLFPALSLGATLGIAIFPAVVGLARNASILRHPALSWLGDRSYSIYMLHVPVYMAINIFIFGSQPVPREFVWPTILTAWVAILVLSNISYLYIENPLRTWLNSIPACPRQEMSPPLSVENPPTALKPEKDIISDEAL